MAYNPLLPPGQATMANSSPVVIASDQTSFPVTVAAGSAVIGHVITDTGSTTAVTGNVTVVQGTGTNLHTVVDSGAVTVSQGTAANLNATVVGTGIFVTQSTVTQATASNLNAQVQGAGASGAAKAGNPVQTGGVFNTTQPTVTNGQGVESQYTARGAQIVATGTDTFNVAVASVPSNQSVNIAQVGGTNTVTGGVSGIIAVGGNVANAVTATANPVPVGGVFVTAPTTLSTGQTATLQFTAAQNVKNDITTLAGTATDTNSGNKSAGTLRTVIATDQPNLTTPLNINVTQFSGTAAVNGSGTATGALRVELANNGTGVMTSIGSITTAVTPGVAAANLGKAEDAIAGSGDTGVAVWGVIRSAPAINAAVGDYGEIPISGQGALWQTPTPSIGGGWTHWDTANDNSNTPLTTTVVTIKGTAATLGGYYIYNSNASVAYVQIFDAATATTITLGTTRPHLTYGIPASSGANIEFSNGIAMVNGIKLAATTTASGSSAPGSGLDVNIYYK